MSGYDSQLITWLVVWVLGMILVWSVAMWRKIPTVGLTVAYLLNLTVNHYFGGVIYALPWYNGANFEFVKRGFIVSAYGAAAFCAGSLILSPLLRAVLSNFMTSVKPHRPHEGLPVAYIFTGFILYFFLLPVLKSIPSIGMLAFSGWSLMIVGVCMAAWKAWKRTGRKILRWTLASILFPIITVVSSGFIGYGIAAIIVVQSFVGCFYKPKWKLVIAAILSLYLGLSLYVTYFRDRDQMREDTWYAKKSLSARVQNLVNTTAKFEWIDFNNPIHLTSIDERLNQNTLVGKSVYLMESGLQKYAGGETLWEALIAFVPRILWPDKPVVAGSGDYVAIYTGEEFAEGTSVGLGQVLEFYINFGISGVVVGFFILGGVISFIDTGAGIRLQKGDWQGCVYWFLPGLAFLQAGGSLVEVASTFAASIVSCVLINKYILGHMSGKLLEWKKIISVIRRPRES